MYNFMFKILSFMDETVQALYLDLVCILLIKPA